MAVKKAAPKKAYLTKRIVKKAVNDALRDASASSMEVMGYVVKHSGGWVVRESAAGHITKISKIIQTSRKGGKINLD